MLNLGLKIVSCQLEVCVNGQNTGLHTLYFSPDVNVPAFPDISKQVAEQMAKEAGKQVCSNKTSKAQQRLISLAPRIMEMHKRKRSRRQIVDELGVSYWQVQYLLKNRCKRLKRLLGMQLNRPAKLHIIAGTERKFPAEMAGR